MRARFLPLVILASALLATACAGGPADGDTRLAEACERQIAQAEPDHGGAPTAESTEERLKEETLVECAGQKVTVAASEEAGEDADEGVTKHDETKVTEDPGSGGEGAAPAKLDPKARSLFAETCGACHVLSDAGTNGTFGPNLDETNLDATGVAQKIEEGGGGMPAGLLEGDDADAVSTYVAGAAAR